MKNQSINRNWNAGKLSATVAIFAFTMLSGCVINNSSDVASVSTTQQGGTNRDSTTTPNSDDSSNSAHGLSECMIDCQVGASSIVIQNPALTPVDSMNIVMKTDEAVDGTIRQGSTSQSSNPGNIVGILLAEFVDHEPLYVPIIRFENKGDNPTWGNPYREGTTPPTDIIVGTHADDRRDYFGFEVGTPFLLTEFYQQSHLDVRGSGINRYYHQRMSQEELLKIDYYTDYYADGDEYIIGGIWQDYDVDADINIVTRRGLEAIGVFVDGGSSSGPLQDTNFNPLSGTADYVGWSHSIRSEEGFSLFNYPVYSVNEHQVVNLNVNFDDETIGGRILNNPNELPDFGPDAGTASDVILERTSFGTGEVGGFFANGVATWERQPDGSTPAVSYRGQWGGQFYGEDGNVFAGTFGVNRDDDVKTDSLLGFFGSYNRNCETQRGAKGLRDENAFNRCVQLTGACNAGGGESSGTYNNLGICTALTGSCSGGDIINGEYNTVGSCIALSGECIGAGIVDGEYNISTGVCMALTGQCDAGGGDNTGDRESNGVCVALTGSCTEAGINVGEYTNVGVCVALTGSCTGAGINVGDRDSTGTCLAVTGTCGTGANAGLRDDAGDCSRLFSTVAAPTADDNNPGILGSIASVIMTNSLMAALLQTKVDDAATATPQAGSMTQSSKTGDRVGIADENSIIYGETGDITLAISNSGSGATWSDVSTEDADIAKSYAAADIGDFKSINLRKEIAGTGNLFVDVRTDIERTADTGTIIRGAEGSPATLSIGNTFTPLGYYTDDASAVLLDIESNHVEGIEIWIPCTGSGCQNLVEFDGVMGILAEEPCTTGCTAHGSLGDTTGASTVETGTNNLVFYPNQFETVVDIDYLVGGTWLYIPDTGSNWEIGAFADGSQKLTNDIPLRTNAIYDGKAIGLRLNNNVVSNFEGDVRLTAAFGNNAGGRGQIDGSITGSDLPAAIELDTATYSLTGNNRGIFTDGETSMEGGYTGKWGGQFYGNIVNPSSLPLGTPRESSVSGTFGVSKGTPGDADSDSFVGFFGGTEQQ